MNRSLMYMAIANGEVDAINAYSTDGELLVGDLKILEDDKGLTRLTMVFYWYELKF